MVVAAGEEGVASHPEWSPDGKHLAFLYQSFTQPPDVWVADVEERDGQLAVLSTRQLTFSMPQALGRKFDPPQKIKYESFDGTMISAYVYQPRQRSSEPGPASIEIHGGPLDQFRDTLHIVVQYYVQRGYTVLMPNVRGSAGYGRDFEKMTSAGWGVDDLKDLVAGAKYLAKQGLAHPQRIAASGQSYGGFMGMMVGCCAPEGVFQASVARTGYADWGYYYTHGGKRTVTQLRYSMGPLEGNEDVYRKSAALKRAHEARTPVFVVDQKADPNVPRTDQRQELVAALRGFGKPVKYKQYENTGGPYARHPSGVKEMLPDVVSYLKQYIG